MRTKKGKIMWKPEANCVREHDAFIRNYENLGNAIIVDAMQCYAKAYHNGDEAAIKAEEKFFRSEFFAILCSLEPEHIMALARKQF